jgi:hypothetical protein
LPNRASKLIETPMRVKLHSAAGMGFCAPSGFSQRLLQKYASCWLNERPGPPLSNSGPELDQDGVGAARMTQSPDIIYVPVAPRFFLAHSRGDRLTWLPKLPDGERRQKAKPPVAPPPDGLRTPAEAARKLHCSVKTLNGYVKSGALKYVAIGHGKRRQRRMFTNSDLDQFIANQTRKDAPCPSTRTRARRTGNSISGGEVIAFTGVPKPRPGGKRKP